MSYAPESAERVRGITPSRVSYSCEVLPGELTLHIGFSLISRIKDAGLESESAATGLLLGRHSESPEAGIVVEDYKPLGDGGTAAAGEAISRWPAGPDRRLFCVGLYRFSSASRPEPTESEIGLFRKHFPRNAAVLILLSSAVRGEIVANVYGSTVGRIHSAKPDAIFPWDSARLQLPPEKPAEAFLANGLATASGKEAAPVNGFRPAASSAPDLVRTAPESFPHAAQSGAWKRAVAVGGCALALAGTSIVAWRGMNWSGSAPAASRPNSPLGMDVMRKGSDLQITWNTAAPAIQSAQGGALRIWEGQNGHAIRLTPDQLKGGRIIYVPNGTDLDVRLEVVTRDYNTVTESIRIFDASDRAGGAVPGLNSAEESRLRTLYGQNQESAAPPTGKSGSAPSASFVPDRIIRPVQESGSLKRRSQQPSAASPAPQNRSREAEAPASPPVSGQAPPLQASLPVQSHGTNANTTTVPPNVAEAPPAARDAAPSSGLRSPAEQAPNPAPPVSLPGSAPAPAAEIPPRPAAAQLPRPTPAVLLTPVELSIPVNLRPFLSGSTVDVRVNVDKNGRVTRVTAVSDRPIHAQFARVVADAARGWRFSPARIRDQAVESEQILKLRLR